MAHGQRLTLSPLLWGEERKDKNMIKLPEFPVSRNYLKELSIIASMRSGNSSELASARPVWEKFHSACEALLEIDTELKGVDLTGIGDWYVKE